VSDKKYSVKKPLPIYSLLSFTLGKVFAECFSGFRHSAKLFPVVYLYISMHIYMLIDLTVVTVYL
jgi:hypothetical protein